MDNGSIVLPHGGYRKLKSFQMSEIVYDGTVKFCKRFVDRHSRTVDQMVQAARSGRQNIAEGCMASGTSKKTELKLIGVARASLEEEPFISDCGIVIAERGSESLVWGGVRRSSVCFIHAPKSAIRNAQ